MLLYLWSIILVVYFAPSLRGTPTRVIFNCEGSLVNRQTARQWRKESRRKKNEFKYRVTRLKMALLVTYGMHLVAFPVSRGSLTYALRKVGPLERHRWSRNPQFLDRIVWQL